MMWGIIIVVVVFINIIGAIVMSEVAGEKGQSGTAAFAMIFFLGIFGYLYVIALPDRTAAAREQELIDLLKQGRTQPPAPAAAATAPAALPDEDELPRL